MILSPSTPSFWPSIVAMMAYLLAALIPPRPNLDESISKYRADRSIWVSLVVGWLGQLGSILVDALSIGQTNVGARFGFAPALSVTTWLVLMVYALESHKLRLPHIRRGLAILAGFTVGLAWFFPGQPHLLEGAQWAPLHWLTGFASYGLFGAALLHAAILNQAERQMRNKSLKVDPLAPTGPVQAFGMPLLQLESLTFRFVGAGFAMLSLTLVLGVTFSAGWKWDHKTVFSILSWVVFATLLIGRAKFGWRGRTATRWLIAGSILLLLAYVGSRFVLEVLLHRNPGP
ncbi:MAG TPA: cytochrome c biogenesis protein CcsA [Aquabacterium sp.]|nr:cytochrome c biogenesis protein CcsA [Aquabacterium sp.]